MENAGVMQPSLVAFTIFSARYSKRFVIFSPVVALAGKYAVISWR
jgi:hypothetical protein